eukprot:690418-Prymnesium_polylepis.1
MRHLHRRDARARRDAGPGEAESWQARAHTGHPKKAVLCTATHDPFDEARLATQGRAHHLRAWDFRSSHELWVGQWVGRGSGAGLPARVSDLTSSWAWQWRARVLPCSAEVVDIEAP